ncbi:protein phosphatase methylesterase [Punctularia strigosozonata HHB-11173 SS5]|uniref:Protein phosphatase methylesterase 1 n=1 Tax=Punctularia strigosozonata (strain HHB-11173) TaxID=741275 RepID=R7S0Q8_PUNST|nr:protein phosphatase methylesterase [Punctularia strigosozonata HHB-11173 SS5]EIN03975.1 protein phosphatase methylesterase [Punctularia strigosozonata HHB-11173 SS5]
MSDLYRSAMHARIAKLPPVPTTLWPATTAPSYDEDEEEDEEDELDSLGDLPTGLGPPAMPAHTPRDRSRTVTQSRVGQRQKEQREAEINERYAPISASGFFEQALQVAVPNRNLDMRVYYTPPQLPQGSNGKGTVLLCHHGAGYSGLSFACFAREVWDMTKGELGVLSVDARAHGKTTSTSQDPPQQEDLSIDVLVQDFVELIKVVYPDPASSPTLLLVGHSMGGAITTRAIPLLQTSRYNITGTVVLDVVEGSALDALPHMNSILNARPVGFDSVPKAVEWHVNTNTIRNETSARVSVPSIVHPTQLKVPSMPAYEWRTPLRSTAPYWESWFRGLSSSFLAARTARLLILAGTDRLDRELTIGQMQGKFQMAVVQGVGHMLHEDDPRKLAEIVVEFWKRNERLPINVKKVGEL